MVAGDLHLAEGSLACGSPQALEHSSPGVIANEVGDGTQDNSGLWPGSCCDCATRTCQGRQTEHRVIPASSLVPAASATLLDGSRRSTEEVKKKTRTIVGRKVRGKRYGLGRRLSHPSGISSITPSARHDGDTEAIWVRPWRPTIWDGVWPCQFPPRRRQWSAGVPDLSRPPSRSRKPLRLASRLAAAYGWNRLITDYRRSRSKHFVGDVRYFCLTVNATNLSAFAAVRPCVIQMIVIIIKIIMMIIIIIIRQQLSW